MQYLVFSMKPFINDGFSQTFLSSQLATDARPHKRMLTKIHSNTKNIALFPQKFYSSVQYFAVQSQSSKKMSGTVPTEFNRRDEG
jgi:hypothetical protein